MLSIMKKNIFQSSLLLIMVSIMLVTSAVAQTKAPKEEDYYKIITLPVPEGILLEVGGVATLPDGRIAVCTRRGDVWLIENPNGENGDPKFKLFASGLHEALGLLWHEGALYSAQR